jgi:hypothetical protein
MENRSDGTMFMARIGSGATEPGGRSDQTGVRNQHRAGTLSLPNKSPRILRQPVRPQ